MGALLAACLAKEVKKIIDQKCSTKAILWTDSQITLYWIKGPSHRWKPFVANRVREIQASPILTRGSTVQARTTQQISLPEELV
ncbi:hypothetical protein TNCT_665671 [Trichonephila clavata]|uniref:Uncharacterized protein n=1 Tax=Trichonephila clavata TaxID=2740835 RepID=A0A8X6H7C6_TRICU|nr:hypothetical protein TNCT_665671 [Trichonephila clavata]